MAKNKVRKKRIYTRPAPKKKVRNYSEQPWIKWLKNNGVFLAAFLGTILVLTILYISQSVYPFGDRAYLRMDFYHQYAPFIREFYDRVHSGKSMLFSWQNGLGLNYWAMYAYYLASPFNWLIMLWPRASIVEACNFFIVLKGGLASLAFTWCLSKKYATRNWSIALFGSIFGLSGYFLAYSCNIIWMDVYALAPIALYGIERIVKGKDAKVYGIAMGLCAISNFYLAVILGMCCVLYFAVCTIGEKNQTLKKVLKALGMFALSTLVAVMVAAVILLPAALALMNTPSGDSEFPKEWESYFPFYEMLVRFAMNTAANQNNGDLPNIFSSVLCVFLLPLYMSNGKIRLRKKISYGVLIAFLLFSFEWNVLDYIWHGLHFPNSFPARQSFFLIFILIMMGYEAFRKRKALNKVAVIISSLVEISALVAGYIFIGKDDSKYGLAIYLCTVAWIGAYALFFLLENKMKKLLFVILFSVLVVGELVTNTLVTGMKSTVSRPSYLEDDAYTKELLEIIKEREGDGFYRVEELDRKCVNDAAWDNYNGMSCFSSTIPGGTKDFLYSFGMRTSNVSYSFQGATPLVTSLFNIKYVFAEKQAGMDKNYFEEILRLDNRDISLYTNKNSLSLGFMLDSDVEQQIILDTNKNPFETQNSLVHAVLGYSQDLFYPVVKEVVAPDDEWSTSAGAEKDQEIKKVRPIKIVIPADKQAFIYTVTYVDEIKITTFTGDEIEGKEEEYDDLKFRRILDLGYSSQERVMVIESDEAKDILNVNAYIMDQDILDTFVERMKEEELQITSYNDRMVEGTIECHDGVLFTSIPYDKGWKVYVDGVEAEAFAYKDAFLATNLSSGTHQITLKYTPPGFVPGLIVTLISSLALAGFCGFQIWKRKYNLEKKG